MDISDLKIELSKPIWRIVCKVMVFLGLAIVTMSVIQGAFFPHGLTGIGTMIIPIVVLIYSSRWEKEQEKDNAEDIYHGPEKTTD